MPTQQRPKWKPKKNTRHEELHRNPIFLYVYIYIISIYIPSIILHREQLITSKRFEATKITTSPPIRSMELTQRLLEVPVRRRSWWSNKLVLPGTPNNHSLKIQICPWKGISPIFLFWGWDWDHQSYSRERSGFLGIYKFINGCLVISNHFLYKDLVHHPLESQPFINGWPWGSR